MVAEEIRNEQNLGNLESLESQENQQESKLIFSAPIARRLLKMHNEIIDIKPDRTRPARSVFVFAVNDKFKDDFNTVLNELADERAKKKNKDKKEKETKE